MGADGVDDGVNKEREPIFRAPWPVLALIAVILAAFAMQSYIGRDAVAEGLGFSPAGLGQGRIAPLFVAMFLHGGWPHALVNSGFILAFGAPVARRFGLDAGGATAFLGFYLVCGALGNLGYAAAHWGDRMVLVGASGAAAGLMGAASRLMLPGVDLAPFRSRPVISMAGAWLGVNLILALLGRVGLSDLAPGSGGALIAWEAHLAGYAAGLILFEPTLRLIRRR
jgi:membrane associated rhomboid family serine protease